MTENRTCIAIPPGATIKERLIDLGMTREEFASGMNMPEEHIRKLLNGELTLTPEIAAQLESVLGIPAQFWNNLEHIYRQKLQAITATHPDATVCTPTPM